MSRLAFRPLLCGSLAVTLTLGLAAGCAGGGSGFSSLFSFFGSPFRTFADPDSDPGTRPPTGGSSGGGGGLGGSGGDRTNADPCSLEQNQKLVRVSLRNLTPDEHIHYFLVMIAFVNGDTYPDGAVCEDDISLYTENGYQLIQEGSTRSFGNFCIEGPALLYFHLNGEFRQANGELASAIEPSRGTGATFDNFFGSNGQLMPVPDFIMFHNPGFGAGFELNVSPKPSDACSIQVGGVTNCEQDAWYYVDENDEPIGSTQLGVGSFRRVPNEIQGTGCECGISGDPFAQLAPSGASRTNVLCNEFMRGGSIQFAFIRDDTTPSFPQLVWRVTDAAGGVAHEFDPRARIP